MLVAKRLIAIVALLLAVLLCACSGGQASEGQSGSASAATDQSSSSQASSDQSSGGQAQEQGSADSANPVTVQVFAMDTSITLTAYGEHAEEALKDAEAEIHRIDDLLSTGNSASEIATLNREKQSTVSEETYQLVRRAKEIGDDTRGVFDISVYPLMEAWGFTDENYRVPSKDELENLLQHVHSDQIACEEDNRIELLDPQMEIDLGGIAKGYTADKVIQVLKEHGVEHALVNLGGNISTLGSKPDGSLWRIGIQDPNDAESFIGGIECQGKVVATSGGYQRYFEENGKTYFHIIDLSDGFPARNGIISATVVSDDGALTDALSTSLFIMGPEKAQEYWRSHKDQFEAVLVEDDGAIWITQGLEGSFLGEEKVNVIKP